MKITAMTVGPVQGNCYIVYDEKSLDAIIIDAGAEAAKILGKIENDRLRVRYIICTHGHFDHVGAVAEIKKRTGAAIVLNREDAEIYMHAGEFASSWGFHIEQPPEPDMLAEEGAEIVAGDMKFRIMVTPGHSPGSLCLYGHGVLFSGDTVFAGSVGRTDFYGGDIRELKKSFVRLLSLPPDTRILPGHGGSSTVGTEKVSNFFVHET